MKKTLTALPVAALLAVSLASCSVPAAGVSDVASAASEGATAGGAGTEQDSPPADDPVDEPEDGEAQFGQTYAWDDGIEVTVTDEGKFRPSDSAYAKGNGPYRQYRIKITNGTGQPFDASSVTVSLASGGEDQEAVIDSAKDVGIRPTTTLRDGKSVSYTEAFPVPDSRDVTLEVAPDYEHDSVLYVKEG